MRHYPNYTPLSAPVGEPGFPDGIFHYGFNVDGRNSASSPTTIQLPIRVSPAPNVEMTYRDARGFGPTADTWDGWNPEWGDPPPRSLWNWPPAGIYHLKYDALDSLWKYSFQETNPVGFKVYSPRGASARLGIPFTSNNFGPSGVARNVENRNIPAEFPPVDWNGLLEWQRRTEYQKKMKSIPLRVVLLQGAELQWKGGEVQNNNGPSQSGVEEIGNLYDTPVNEGSSWGEIAYFSDAWTINEMANMEAKTHYIYIDVQLDAGVNFFFLSLHYPFPTEATAQLKNHYPASGAIAMSIAPDYTPVNFDVYISSWSVRRGHVDAQARSGPLAFNKTSGTFTGNARPIPRVATSSGILKGGTSNEPVPDVQIFYTDGLGSTGEDGSTLMDSIFIGEEPEDGRL